MNHRRNVWVAVVSVAVLAAGAGVCVAGDRRDAPRPDVWKTRPTLKQALDKELAAMEKFLVSLEPKAFAVNYGKLASLAASDDAKQRDRAFKAIGNLQDPTGLPILAKAVRDRPAGGESHLQAVMSLGGWIYDAYHTDGRKPPEKLRPLLGLFVKTLVEAGDEPNVRAYCFQAIGSLAGPEWLPLVQDLADSRHPAVTHWSSWAAKQIQGRCDPEVADPLLKSTYILPEAERLLIVQRIRRLLAAKSRPAGKETICYSEDISHFDHWIPQPGSPKVDEPDRREYYIWRVRAGRVTRVDFDEDGERRVAHRVWYNEKGAPILTLNSYPSAPDTYVWGEYDSMGLLCRLVRFRDDFGVQGVDRLVNTGVYDRTTVYKFDAKGQMHLRTRYTGEGVFVYHRQTGVEKRVNSGSRRHWMCRLTRGHGLASVYPIPDPPYEPAKLRLAITKLAVDPAVVEHQCTGSLTVRNVGSSYTVPSDKIGPYYMLHIYDAAGTLLFRAGGGWSGQTESGNDMDLTFDTHSNTIPGAGGAKFLLPKPGRYTLKITLLAGQLTEPLDEKTVAFDVGLYGPGKKGR